MTRVLALVLHHQVGIVHQLTIGCGKQNFEFRGIAEGMLSVTLEDVVYSWNDDVGSIHAYLLGTILQVGTLFEPFNVPRCGLLGDSGTT